MKNKTCRVCNVKLDNKNWAPSNQKRRQYICKKCENERTKAWQKANPEKKRATDIRADRKRGIRPFDENKKCSKFLGCHVAERILSHVFKDVEVMPFDNPGFDFICNKGKKIDVKSSCLHPNGAWGFIFRHNTTADYFLCLAFDNREYLNPLHVWIIPGNVVNHLTATSIRPSSVHRWDDYRLDISKIVACCDAMKR